MHAQKKKSRQRNRPRNKANKIHESNSDTEQTVQQNEVTNQQSELNGNSEFATELSHETEPTEASVVPPTVPKPSSSKATTGELIDSGDAIKLIQRILRAKLLKQQQHKENQAPPNDVNVQPPSPNIPPVANISHIEKSKPTEQLSADFEVDEKNAFIVNLKKKMAQVMANADNTDLPNTLLDNIQKLFSQPPVSDVESSDNEEEYIEYIYKPRSYFLVSLCNYCKSDLRGRKLIECSRCKMTYYCTSAHMKSDQPHRQLCYALREVAENCNGHIFYKCADFSTEQFRSYRIVTIRKVESIMNRTLTATEQEVILFPRICSDIKCREYCFSKLVDCQSCGQVAFCSDKPAHLNKLHSQWCRPFQLFKELIMFQEKFGRLEPSLPTKILRDIPGACSNTKQILSKLAFDMQNQCEYAALSQISTGPLTAWYALRLSDQLKKHEVLTVHLIGAEIEFEVDALHKWELFFLHITPAVKELNIVFVGPELNPRNISFEQLKKTKCCRVCRKNTRTVNYHFENQIYHEYCVGETFLPPDLICFFNAGLYRSTGFQMEDTWPETILAAANLKCPVVVTSYTEYEAPLDMTRFVQESNRRLNVVLPPTMNPFASDKPERNFISEENAPLMFKNYYCFVVE